jgi:hypothetical protein
MPFEDRIERASRAHRLDAASARIETDAQLLSLVQDGQAKWAEIQADPRYKAMDAVVHSEELREALNRFSGNESDVRVLYIPINAGRNGVGIFHLRKTIKEEIMPDGDGLGGWAGTWADVYVEWRDAVEKRL